MGKTVRWILGRDLKKRNYYPKRNLEKLIMENNLIGIVKFFRDETYLNRLVDDGCIYCKTPENYRLESLEGVGDKFESCKFSYRAQRNDSVVFIEVDGCKIHNSDLTIHAQGGYDSWLHCWLALTLPTDPKGLENLINDIKQVKSEFGNHYAFIPANKIKNFSNMISRASSKPMMFGQVLYYEDQSKWSIFSESNNYSYQREFRFIFGECGVTEINPYVFYCENGFKNIIEKTPELKLISSQNRYAFFDLKYI